MSGELADMDGDRAYEEGFHQPLRWPIRSAQEDFGGPDNNPALALCTDPKVWADEFFKAFPELSNEDVLSRTGMTRRDVAAWFDAAMETKRMMAIASLPLPPMY